MYQTIREEFRAYLKQQINERPENLYDMTGLQSKEDYKEKVISNFNKINDKKIKS